MAIFSAIAGAIGGGAMDLGGQWLANKFIAKPNATTAWRRGEDAATLAYQRSEAASAAAFDRSYDAYKNRYSNTMADMKKAGLNPILAAGSGGFNVGSAPQMKPAQAFMPNAPLAVQKDYQWTSSGKNLAESGKAEEETKKAWRQAQKARSDTLLNLERIVKTRAEKGLITAEESATLKRIKVLIQQHTNLVNEAHLIVEKENITVAQRKLIWKQTETLRHSMEQLKKISKVYQGPAGQLIAYLHAIMNALNINIGVFGGVNRPAAKPKQRSTIRPRR